MPVSSSTSRTAASSAVSPASTWPLGSDQSSRPRRSTPADQRGPRARRRVRSTTRPPAEVSSTLRRPRARAAGCAAGAAAAEAGTGHPSIVASRPTAPVGARGGAGGARRTPYPCLPCPTCPRPRPPRPRDADLPAARRRLAAGLVRARAGARRAGRAVRGGGSRAGPGRRLGAGRAARPAVAGPRLHHRRPARRSCASWSSGWADAWWEVGIAFGTVGAPQGRRTWSRSRPTAPRSTATTSRKPEVAYGDSLEDDLLRRDFTVNAMAVALPAARVRRPVRRAGATWPRGVLRTPGRAGGLVRRRPAADAAGGPVRRPARASTSTPRWSPR